MSHKLSGLFLQNKKKLEENKNVFHAVNFDSIKIFINWPLQNDCLNRFVKAINVVGQKMVRNGCKMANAYCCDLYTASDYT